VLPLFVGGAASGLRCRMRHPSRGRHPVWLLEFCRCSNQKCCAAPHELCANAVKLQWLTSTLSGLLRVGHVDRSESQRRHPWPRSNRHARSDARAVWGAKPSSPAMCCAAANPRPAVRLPRSLRSLIPRARALRGPLSRPASLASGFPQNSVQMRKIQGRKQPPV